MWDMGQNLLHNAWSDEIHVMAARLGGTWQIPATGQREAYGHGHFRSRDYTYR